MKYIITKSMKRSERAALCSKIYQQLCAPDNIGTYKFLKKLINQVKDKKKKNLLKSNEVQPYVTASKTYKGLKVYFIVNHYEGYDVVINTSPIDAGYVEYIRVIPNGNAVIYTQHLFDRYNERVYNKKLTTYKDMMLQFFIDNQIKAALMMDKDNSGKISQRVEDGFLMGMTGSTNNYCVMNTFYDNEEYKDNETKDRTRTQYKKLNDLSSKELEQYNDLTKQWANGDISEEDLYHLQGKYGLK